MPVKKNCSNCKISIEVPKYKLRVNNFCSRDCYNETRYKNVPIEDRILFEQQTRICKSCNEEKTLKKFGARMRNGKLVCSNICIPCIHKVHQLGAPNPVSRNRNDIKEGQEMKICVKCNEEKPLFSFPKYKKAGGIIGRTAKCNGCKQSPSAIRRTYKQYQRNGVWVKFCTSCQTTKPLTEFVKSLKSYARCKNCHNKEQNSTYRNATPEQILKRREQKSRYSSTENGIKFRKAYQARKRGAKIVVKFTKSDLIKRDGLLCYLCDKILTEKAAQIEHILPLSRGGNHKPENVKLACKSCNCSKNNKTLTEFKKYRGDYARFTVNI